MELAFFTGPIGGMTRTDVRQEVAERDGAWCLLCGRPGPGLHLHRVNYGSEGGKYEVGNCVQLCRGHHDLVHSAKRTWKPLLVEHLQRAGRGVFDPLEAARLRRQMAELAFGT